MDAHAHESHIVGTKEKGHLYLSALSEGGAPLLGISHEVFPVNHAQEAAAFRDRQLLTRQ